MRLVLLILAFYVSACNHASFGVGKVIDTVVCKADPSQSYALYIPAINNGSVIYCFDAHGAGSLPLRKYQSLADKYGFILVGSNNSKNGNDWSVTEHIWTSLFEDTQQRLKIDTSHLYVCGFSGGAKVAGYIALKYPVVKSVIANGAPIPSNTTVLPFNYTAIAGEGDLNLTDIVAFDNAITSKHHLILFDGKHEWAPVATMNIAFAGLLLDAGITPKDYIAASKARLDSYLNYNLLLKAAEECRLSISYLPQPSYFLSQLASLTNNPTYQQQFQEQQATLIKEQNIKVEYAQHFEDVNTDFWVKTIQDLKNNVSDGDGFYTSTAAAAEGAMDQRLLTYLSLAFYSYSNHFMQGNSNEAARHFVDLYKLADATNSEAWYFSAVLYARANDAAATQYELLKAVENGFKDKARLQQQNEIQQLAGSINMGVINAKMN